MDEGAAVDDDGLFRRFLFRLIPEVNLCFSVCVIVRPVLLGSESLATACQGLTLAHEASQAFLCAHKRVRGGGQGVDDLFCASQCPFGGISCFGADRAESKQSGHVLSPVLPTS